MPVVLVGGEAVSGLAEMLQQFIEQTLADSPRKVEQARRLSGHAVFRSAEDDDICVRIAFTGDRVELHDGRAPVAADASITADFLTIAHLTSGRENPFWLLARQKLRARFSPRQVPFLLGLLRFMQIETPARSDQRHARWLRWLWPAAAIVAAGAFYRYLIAAP